MAEKRTYKYWVVVRKGDAVIATHLCDTLEEARSYERKGKVKIKKIMV